MVSGQVGDVGRLPIWSCSLCVNTKSGRGRDDRYLLGKAVESLKIHRPLPPSLLEVAVSWHKQQQEDMKIPRLTLLPHVWANQWFLCFSVLMFMASPALEEDGGHPLHVDCEGWKVGKKAHHCWWGHEQLLELGPEKVWGNTSLKTFVFTSSFLNTGSYRQSAPRPQRRKVKAHVPIEWMYYLMNPRENTKEAGMVLVVLFVCLVGFQSFILTNQVCPMIFQSWRVDVLN